MNHINIIKASLLSAVVAIGMTACDDDITYGNVQAPELSQTVNPVYVADAAGSTTASQIQFRDNGSVDLFAQVNQAHSADHTVSFAYSQTALDAYNAVNGTEYTALPQSMVTLSNDGIVTLQAGTLKSEPMTLTVASDGTLEPGKQYVVPLSVTVTSGPAALASQSATRLVFVNDLTGTPDCYKMVTDDEGNLVPGVKVFSCMEVNDTNPLNNLCFTLKDSGKYLVDALIIFSANINYNAETGRVYVLCNENVQALLDNRAKYLQPLQDRGMKIILGLLGNHDRSGVANLSDETAREFAKEVKAVCDAYHLDGVFYDDEYSAYQYPVPAGFVSPSTAAASRLIYEVKQAQPHRINVAYAYSRTYGLDEVDGVQAGDYCDYALHDYGGSSDLSSSFPGMPKSNMGLYSQEFNLGRFASLSNLKRMRQNGYGSHMIFAMDPNRSNQWRQLDAMENIAEAFYDDEVVYDGKPFSKDW